MKRILNPAKRLRTLLQDGQDFYIGFGAADLTPLAKSNANINNLISGLISSIVVTGKSGVLKENTEGKMVRVQPERKVSVWKHIHYFSKKHNREIDYDREFLIWEKEVAHRFYLPLFAFKTPQGEIILCFSRFAMKDDDIYFLQVRAAMNMSIVLSSYYQLYDTEFEPILAVTKVEIKELLKSGTLSITEKLSIIKEEIMNPGLGGKSSIGHSYRLAALTEKNPSDITIGSGGFDNYLMFDFQSIDLIVFENLNIGNATFMFSRSGFDKSKELDKQNALDEPSFLGRIVHTNIADWSSQFNLFFN